MFNPEKLYRANDPALSALASKSTMATWRGRAQGPRFIRANGRVLYRGADLNSWLEQNIVQTEDGKRSTQ